MQMIESAAWSGDTLWLLSSTGSMRSCGTLFSLERKTRTMAEIRISTSGMVEQFLVLPGEKILVATSNGELWQYFSGKAESLSFLPPSPLPDLLDRYGLNTRSMLDEVQESGIVKGKGCPLFPDRILNMFLDGHEILILTSTSLLRYDLVSGIWHTVPLQHLIPKAIRMPAVLPGDGYIYQGTCIGEWGGDLKRVDIASGAVDILFEGTQVTSVVATPWDPRTALFSTGSWHMGLNRGGISHTSGKKEPLLSGKAVYSMTSGEEGIFAATRDGVYRIHRDGSSERYDYPDQEGYGGVAMVSDPQFGTFVLTEIYRSVMLCGLVPLFPEKD